MSVQPITDSKSQLKWIHQHDKIKKKSEDALMNIEDGIAFITDFSSPTDYNRSTQSSSSKQERPVKKNKPLSHTSENWIG